MNTILVAVGAFLMCCSMYAQVQPSGGAREVPIAPGTQIEITWPDGFANAPVSVELWNGTHQTTTVIAAGVSAAAKRYSWTVPTDIEGGTQYRFAIRDQSKPNRAMYSPSYVSISRSRAATTAVDEGAKAELRTKVDPTPASEEIHLHWNVGEFQNAAIVDLTGATVLRCELPLGSSTRSVDVRALPAGAYTVVFSQVGGRTASNALVIHR